MANRTRRREELRASGPGASRCSADGSLLEPEPKSARYRFVPSAPFWQPFQPTPFLARIELELSGQTVHIDQPVEYRYEDVAAGEKRMELKVVPAFSVVVTPDIVIVPTTKALPTPRGTQRGVEREVRVTVVNGSKGAVEGEVSLSVPAGWTTSPATAPVAFGREDEARTVRFTVKVPGYRRPR